MRGWFMVLLLLGGCANGAAGSLASVLVLHHVTPPSNPDALLVCRDHGCATSTVVMWQPQWDVFFTKLFTTTSPASEREAIATAVGFYERSVGGISGTDQDLPRTFAGVGKTGQQDCTDEAITTSLFLEALAQRGYLRYHTPAPPVRRGRLGRWPHISAAIAERGSGAIFAVDSWPNAAGSPAVSQPLPVWLRE